MKKTVLLSLFVFVVFSANLLSKPIELSVAKKVAVNFYGERAKAFYKVDYTDLSFQHVYTKTVNDVNLYYIFNVTFKENEGFIVISADDDVYPVLCYSFKSGYSQVNIQNEQPDAFVEWLDNYESQILYVKQNALQADVIISDEWSKLKSLNEINNTKQITSVGPLLTTTWRQTQYYNDLCPYHASSPWGQHCPVGCVALAMAQVMKYWNYPAQGSGSHSYVSNLSGYNFGTLSADFGATTYNWANMPNSLTGANTSVATLCYHVGVSVDMQYTPMGSGTYSSYPANALKTYFKYKSTAQFVLKSAYTDANWKSLIKGELDAGRPVIYRGGSTSGGHSFVCDGYQGINNDHYHFVFGDNAMPDGYFYLTSINPGTYNFSQDQQATVGIEPINSSISENTSNHFDANIYPNPAFDMLFIEVDNHEPVQLKLINMLGEVVLSKEIEASTSLDVSSLAKGLYFAEIFSNENQRTVKKIIKE